MRRAELSKGSDHWLVTVMDDGVPVSWGWYDVPTHAEAMSLAQLLVDPARYIRQAEQRAWAEGHKAGVLQEYFRVPGVPNTPNGETQ